MGDTILSIPVVEAIKRKYPQHTVSFLTRKYCKSLFDNNEFIDELIIDEEDVLKKNGSISGFFSFVKEIQNKNFDIIIILHPEFRLNLLALLAGIKKRVAPASKIYQFLANIRITQKRSLCRIHEADYNLDLVRRIFNDIPRIYPKIVPNFKNIENMKKYKGNNPFLIVHPGSGGSARNWSLENYKRLIMKISKKSINVFISWGPGEEKIREFFDDIIDGKNIKTYDKNIELSDYIALISLADVILTSSTGPLHIGAALGIKSVSLFCPVRVCSPVRWGPHSRGENFVFIPQDVPQCEKCIGEKCIFFDCMEKIEVDEVCLKIKNMLKII